MLQLVDGDHKAARIPQREAQVRGPDQSEELDKARLKDPALNTLVDLIDGNSYPMPSAKHGRPAPRSGSDSRRRPILTTHEENSVDIRALMKQAQKMQEKMAETRNSSRARP